MNTFKNIPIRVELPSPLDDTAIARSVLNDIRILVATFVSSGQTGAIDLRHALPMGPRGYQFLKQTLSAGEVTATINGTARTEIRETAYPGVWWVTHRNRNDEIVTELIEVAAIPEILKSQPEDIRYGLQQLSRRLTNAGPEFSPECEPPQRRGDLSRSDWPAGAWPD